MNGSRRPRTSTATSSPSETLAREERQRDPLAQGRREGPGGHRADRRVAGEHLHARARDATAGRDETTQHAVRALRLLGDQRVLAPERVLLPADRPPQPRLHGRDVEADVLAVQRVAHLRAQGVAGAEPARQQPVRLPRRHERVPEGKGVVVLADQLVAALPRVAGAAHDHRRAVERRLGERHVVVPARQPDGIEHLVGPRPLHGQHGVRAVVVHDLHPVGRLGAEPTQHLGGVRGVGHEEHLLVAVEVGDQVVDDAAGLGVAAQGVLRLARLDLAEVVAQRRVDEGRSTRPAHEGLAEVADVEDADRLAHRGVLLDHSRPGVLQRHRPAAELRELRTERDVPLVQRRGQQVAHGAEPTAARRPLRPD